MEESVEYPSIEIEFRGATHASVAWLWLNRPAQYNTIDRLLMQELTKAVMALDKDPHVRVIILAARGAAFSHGADLGWLQRQSTAPLTDVLSDNKRLAHMLEVIAECATPTIARVQGAANGIGAGLAAACDICIATATASFAVTDAQLGMIPTVISPYLIRAIGARHCYRYFQSAEHIPARRAYELGLVHEVTTPAHLDIRLHDIASALLQCDPVAQAAATRLIRRVAAANDDDGYADSLRQGAKLRALPASRDRLSLLQEKSLGTPFKSSSRNYPLLDVE